MPGISGTATKEAGVPETTGAASEEAGAPEITGTASEETGVPEITGAASKVARAHVATDVPFTLRKDAPLVAFTFLLQSAAIPSLTY